MAKKISQMSSTLASLNFTDNYIRGGQGLIKLLKETTQLEELHLGNCDLCGCAVDKLFQVIPTLPDFDVLDLSGIFQFYVLTVRQPVTRRRSKSHCESNYERCTLQNALS